MVSPWFIVLSPTFPTKSCKSLYLYSVIKEKRRLITILSEPRGRYIERMTFNKEDSPGKGVRGKRKDFGKANVTIRKM